MAKPEAKVPVKVSPKKFPSEDSEQRLRMYGVYERLLSGDHFSAYSTEVGKEFQDRYQALRYVTCNFAGLISKVIADVLFGEGVGIEAKKNNEGQKFVDALIEDNELPIQFYESSLFNSARGDAVFRIRVEDNKIKIEDINPSMYFPKLSSNFRETPKEDHIMWKESYMVGDKKKTFLIDEKYTKGSVDTSVYLMKDENTKEVDREYTIEEFNNISGNNYVKTVETKIDESLIVHVPNFRMKSQFFGTSDYGDLESLFFAINNRFTKIDNILDKHSDPILAVPEGILDENGQVKKESLGMVEVADGEGKPEYIVWNANLESAFTQIDEIIKMIFLMSEISPDVVGIDSQKSAAESGRALKFRMLRTLAKKNRKQLYYEVAIQKLFRVASKLAKANGFVAGNEAVGYKGDPLKVSVIFGDGVIDDKVEQVEMETTKYEAGLTSQKSAIKKIEDFDDDEAQKLIDEIEKDKEGKADFNADTLFHNSARQMNSDNQEINNDQSRSGKESSRAK